jgi:hypothetical protein
VRLLGVKLLAGGLRPTNRAEIVFALICHSDFLL